MADPRSVVGASRPAGTDHPSFDGLFNFRDVGGLSASGGRRTRYGMLYRSDAFGDVSAADVARLENDLGITRLIDLRADREIAGEGPTPLAQTGIEHRYWPIDSGPGNAIETAPPGERLAYRYLEYLQFGRASIVGAITDLADPAPQVTVVHCRVGKDRTGVTIGIALALVGVERDEIVADYARTSAGLPAIMARLRESPTYAANVNRLPGEIYQAEAATMARFFDMVDERFGGVDGWAEQSGIRAELIEQLSRNLTEPAD